MENDQFQNLSNLFKDIEVITAPVDSTLSVEGK